MPRRSRCMMCLPLQPCVLCGGMTGAMKRTCDFRWAHIACALWIPEGALRRTALVQACRLVCVCARHLAQCSSWTARAASPLTTTAFLTSGSSRSAHLCLPRARASRRSLCRFCRHACTASGSVAHAFSAASTSASMCFIFLAGWTTRCGGGGERHLCPLPPQFELAHATRAGRCAWSTSSRRAKESRTSSCHSATNTRMRLGSGGTGR